MKALSPHHLYSSLFEDGRFLVVDKPSGLLTIPGRDLNEPSLIEILRKERPELLVVHRIDRETSGCVLFAKNPDAHREANRWFEKHDIKKEYLALVVGELRLPVMRIDTPIENQKALTQVSVIEKFKNTSFLRVRIQTGRRHQIRIHLSQQGHAILGDVRYKGPKTTPDGLEIKRVALHAESLQFPGGVKIMAPIPADFENWLTHLRASS